MTTLKIFFGATTISCQKSNFNGGFKLEPVTTYRIRFVVEILWT